MLELEGNEPLSPATLGYLCANTRDSYFSYVHMKLLEAEATGIKRKDIAGRIRKTETRLSHILAAPGNWTLDTITELLAAISNEEIVPQSLPLLRVRHTNCCAEKIMEHNTREIPKITFGVALPSIAQVISEKSPIYVPA